MANFLLQVRGKRDGEQELEITMYTVTILAEKLICTCPKSNLALRRELLDIRAQHFLIYYLGACKRQSHFLLLKF